MWQILSPIILLPLILTQRYLYLKRPHLLRCQIFPSLHSWISAPAEKNCCCLQSIYFIFYLCVDALPLLICYQIEYKTFDWCSKLDAVLRCSQLQLVVSGIGFSLENTQLRLLNLCPVLIIVKILPDIVLQKLC